MPAPPNDDAAAEARAPFLVRVPAFFIAVAFAGGIAAAQVLYRPPAFLLFASAIGFLAALRCPRVSRAFTSSALLLAWFCGGLFCAEVQPQPAPSAALQRAFLQPDGPIAVTATVLPMERPRPRADNASFEGAAKRSAVELDVALLSVDGISAASPNWPQEARITLLAQPNDVVPTCGSVVAFTAKLHSPPRFYTPGAFNEAAWLAQQGIFAEGTVHADALSASSPPHASLACILAAARNHALDRLDLVAARMSRWPARWQFAALTPQDATMLAAALLGDRSRLDASERSAFQRVGAFHLLVVSGLSVAILGGVVWWSLRRLRAGPVTATLLTLGLLTSYAALTGMEKPVQRALIMAAIYMAGRLLYRRASPLNTLSLAALVLLAMSPSALLTASLQMTLLAVIAIAGVASPLLVRTIIPWLEASRSIFVPLDPSLPPRLAQFRVTLRMWARALRPALGVKLSGWLPGALVRALLRLCELAFVSFVLELALAIPMATDFHRIVALGVGANLLTVPLLAMLLPLALLTLLLANFSIPAALAPAAVTACLLHLAAAAVHRIALLPSAEWRTPPTRPVAIVLAMACLFAAILLAHQARRLCAATTLALTFGVGLLALWTVPLRLHQDGLEVAALDVGQGDSLFVASPGGNTLLVDAGGPAGPFNTPGSGDFYGEEIVSPYLWSRGIRRLDAVALTHAHSDHMGGMPSVLRNFRPRELWVGTNPPVASYEQLLALARSLGLKIRILQAGDTFQFGGSTVQVLAPTRDYKPGTSPSNDDSLVLHITRGDTSVLLEGDAQSSSERAMMASADVAPSLHSDLLKVGHHGSLSSTTPEFLAAVHPEWAVISAGRHNLFGHPRYPILQRLGDAEVHVYRTDLDGASSFLLNGQDVVPIAP